MKQRGVGSARTVDEMSGSEASQLIECFKHDAPAILGLLERQLSVLHTRGQLVIGFGSIVITTTGFSGRMIAGTHPTAQVSIIIGLVLVLLSCIWTFLKVMRVEWVVSTSLQSDLYQTVQTILHYRDSKTWAYRIGGYGVFVGFAIYVVAIAIMLLNPEPLTVPVR